MDINTIKSKILVQYPLFGSVLANVNFVSDESVYTACTDGKNIYYNPKFLDTLNEDEQTFIIVHEICHIAFEHITRSKDKNSILWNIATDSVVNALLECDGLPLVEGCVVIDGAINFNAEEMYEKLLEEQKKNENNEYSKDEEGPSASDSGFSPASGQNQQNAGHDDHSMWEDVVKNHENFDDGKTDDKDIDEQDAFAKNNKDKKDLLEKLKDELTKTATGHGNNSQENNDITINNVGTAQPLIDWKKLLREATRYTVDWSYQNAYIENGVLVPTLEKMYQPETEILLDTSGSISKDLLKNFLRECKHIINTSKLKVGCFDTEFYGFTEIKKISDIDRLPFRGGGYTDFDVAIDSFTRRAQNKIIFTDGYASMPSKSLDAIWVVFGDNEINPPGGKVIYIDKKDLNNLTTKNKVKTKNK